MSLSFTDPPVEIADEDPVSKEHSGATPAPHSPGYHLAPGEGPAIWFQGGLITMKARATDTDGGYALTEWYGPRGMVAPGHKHTTDAEAFFILEGTLDIGVGDRTYQATPGSFIHVPKDTVHDWRVTSASCRFLVFILPAGFEHFFEELGEGALSPSFPYTDHRQPSFEEIVAVGSKYGWAPGEGPTGTGSTAPPTAGRLVVEDR